MLNLWPNAHAYARVTLFLLANLIPGPVINRKEIDFMTTEKTKKTTRKPLPWSTLTPAQQQELIYKLQQNDQEALAKVCQYFTPLVESYARSYTVHRILGEDALGIAWIIFLEAAKKYHKKDCSRLAGYFKRVLCSRLLNVLIKECKRRVSLEDDATKLADTQVSPFDEVVINNLDLALALRMLKPNEQRLIYLYYFEDMTIAAIAKELHKSATALRWSKKRILKKLRVIMNK